MLRPAASPTKKLAATSMATPPLKRAASTSHIPACVSTAARASVCCRTFLRLAVRITVGAADGGKHLHGQADLAHKPGQTARHLGDLLLFGGLCFADARLVGKYNNLVSANGS